MDLSKLGTPGITVKHTSTDSVQRLTDVTGMVMKSGDNKNVDKVLITVETNPIAFAWGADPAPTGVGHRLAPWAATGDPFLVLEGSKAIFGFRFISYAAQSAGIMQITPFYRKGVK